MDFNLTDDMVALKKELETFFQQEMNNAPPDFEGGVSSFDSDQRWAFDRYMAKKLVEKGWLTMAWPKENVGQDASILDQMLFNEIQAT